MILVHTPKTGFDWRTARNEDDFEQKLIRTPLDEIYDLAWSPDSSSLLAGSVDGYVCVVRLGNKVDVHQGCHKGFVQGVSWDPLNSILLSLGNDRSCRLLSWKEKERKARNIRTLKKRVIPTKNEEEEEGEKKREEERSVSPSSEEKKKASHPMFADSTLSSFFRRPSFTPDGSLLLLPSGLCPDGELLSHCCWGVLRDRLEEPSIVWGGMEEPAIGIKSSPFPFPLPPPPTNPEAPQPLSDLPHRYLVAVITTKELLFFDTHSPNLLGRVRNSHLAPLTDLAWTRDGRGVIVTSYDGFVSMVRLDQVGRPILQEEVGSNEEKKEESIETNQNKEIEETETPPPVIFISKKKRPKKRISTILVSSSLPEKKIRLEDSGENSIL